MTVPRVQVRADEDSLARAVAQELVSRLAEPGTHHLVLTGGGVGTRVLVALRDASSAVPSPVDWGRVHLWWGDERFVPSGDADRNETGARSALIDHIPIPSANVHPMPADNGQGLDAATAAYADELAAASEDGRTPEFDVLLLGMGPEGHVASLFPHADALHAAGTTVSVPDSPKPPPQRISLTLAAIRSASEVWVVASGAAKSEAVRAALDPSVGFEDLPAAGARGRRDSVFWVDDAAWSGRG